MNSLSCASPKSKYVKVAGAPFTYIYAMLCPAGEVRYVGKTSHPIEVRFRQQLKAAYAKRFKRRHLACWIRSLAANGEQPSIVLLETVIGDGCAEEREWIRKLKKRGARLVNHTEGGEGTTGHRMSPEQRHNISIAKRNTSPETRLKMSMAKRGKKMPASVGLKQSLRQLGRRDSEATRAKKAAAIQAWWDSHPHTPRVPKVTEETRAKMAEARRLYWFKKRNAVLAS